MLVMSSLESQRQCEPIGFAAPRQRGDACHQHVLLSEHARATHLCGRRKCRLARKIPATRNPKALPLISCQSAVSRWWLDTSRGATGARASGATAAAGHGAASAEVRSVALINRAGRVTAGTETAGAL
ncbi:unnamed protein product [Ixodes hexagonus]